MPKDSAGEEGHGGERPKQEKPEDLATEEGTWRRYEGTLNDGGAGRLRHVDVGNELYVTPYSPTERLRPKRVNECRKVRGRARWQRMHAQQQFCFDWRHAQGDNVGMCAADSRIAYAVELEYPTWVIEMPKFIREEHRSLFLQVYQVLSYMKQHDSKDCQLTNCKGVTFPPSERLVFHNPEYTYGHLVVVCNGTRRTQVSMCALVQVPLTVMNQAFTMAVPP